MWNSRFIQQVLHGSTLKGKQALLAGILVVAIPTLIRAMVGNIVLVAVFLTYVPFVILAAVQDNFWLGFAAATTLILGAAYTLWMVKRVIFGDVANAEVAKLEDLNRREFWLLALLAVAVLAMGIWPKPFVDVMHTSVTDLLAHVARSKL